MFTSRCVLPRNVWVCLQVELLTVKLEEATEKLMQLEEANDAQEKVCGLPC